MKNIALTPPEWLARNAVYQINPRTFSKEGTITAITDELEYLKSIGFNTIYLCPIFQEDDSTDKAHHSRRQLASETGNPKNPYRMNDYFFIDSEYGTMEDLRNLADELHKRDMKLILDLVYAHIGPNAPIINSHPDFVKRTPDGEIICTEWNFPALDFRSRGLREYLYCNMVYYTSVIGADGFRCDVGDDVPEDFWVEAKRRIQSINPDAILINEGNLYERLTTAFDSSYFWNWHEVLYDIFTGKSTAAELRRADEEAKALLPRGSLLLRDIDNHDTVTDWPERTEIAAGSDGMEQIEIINYIIDGIPMVYCGNELACKAKLNMFANRFYPGKFQVTDRNQKETPKAIRRQELFKKLNALKNESDILRFGETIWLDNSNANKIISFARTFCGKTIVFAGNSSTNECAAEISTIPDNADVVFANGFNGIKNGTLTFAKHGYAVLKY